MSIESHAELAALRGRLLPVLDNAVERNALTHDEAYRVLDALDALAKVEELTHRVAKAEGSRDMAMESACTRLARAEAAERRVEQTIREHELTMTRLHRAERRVAELEAGINALAVHYERTGVPPTVERWRALLSQSDNDTTEGDDA